MKQYTNALKELFAAEKNDPDNPKIHYFIGMAYHGKGLKDKAIEEFKKAISLKEDYSEAHNYLGTLYMDGELWDQAISEFDKALNNVLYDTPAFAIYHSAWAYYNKGDLKTALAKYRQALNVDPMTSLRPQIEKNVGLIYSDQGNVVEAILHFRKAVELDPTLLDAHFLLAECYLKIKDTEQARKSFQSVIKLSPNSSFGQKAKIYLQSLK